MDVRVIRKDYPDDPHRNLAIDEAIFREVEVWQVADHAEVL